MLLAAVVFFRLRRSLNLYLAIKIARKKVDEILSKFCMFGSIHDLGCLSVAEIDYFA